MAFTIINQGSFTSTGVGVKILTPSSVDYFKTINYTQMNLTGSVCVGGEWFNGISAANDGVRWRKAGSSVIQMDLFSTSSASGGFTYVTKSPVVEAQAANAITGVTQANPAVVSQTNTYSNGDILRIYNTVGDLTVGGMDFQISSASGSGYTLLGLPATAANGFTAMTAGFTRRISSNVAVDPEFLYVTNISQATSAVVSTSVDPSQYYVLGMKVHFSVPSSFGMTQMNGLTGTITALNVGATTNTAAYNMVVNIDSSAFTAFVFPASAGSPTSALFATVAPQGASTQFNQSTGLYTGYDFSKQPFHTGQETPYMYLAGGSNSPAGAASDVIIWQAYKMETLSNN